MESGPANEIPLETIEAGTDPVSPVGPKLFFEIAQRHIAGSVQCMLWGRAAARCEFAGCNKPLWRSSVTQEQVNIGQKAHIYAFSRRGPRGNDGIPKRELNNVQNLILVCHECHRNLDDENTAER